MSKNYYLVLGVSSDSSLEDIKEAYRRQAKIFHPDRTGKSHAPFLEIQEAYSVLSDPTKRQHHDSCLACWKKPEIRRPARGIYQKLKAEPLIPDVRSASPLTGGQPFCLSRGGQREGHVSPRPELWPGREDIWQYLLDLW